MILGSGVDLCEVPRIEAAVARYGRRFLERIYTPREIAYADRKANRFERYAARFAAKEAGMKALGTGWHGVAWRDFEVDKSSFRPPHSELSWQGRGNRREAWRQTRGSLHHAHQGTGAGHGDPGERRMTIRVETTGDDVYQVTVESDSTTQHTVTVTPEYWQRLTGGRVSVETLIEKSFEFLLERESNTSILRSFDLPVIQRYFPEYERTIGKRLL